MVVHFHPHAQKRMEERGTTKKEVEITLKKGEGVVGDCCILRMYRFSVNTSKSFSRGEFPPLVKGLIFLPSN